MKQPTKLWNKDFLLLWQGQLVSQVGSKAFVVGMMYWVQQTTGSASLVAALLTLATLPGVLIGPLTGAFADRYSRRAIIVIADGVSGLGSLCVAILFYSYPGQTTLLIVVLFTVAFVNGIARAFFRPSVSAAIPDLVPPERITAANSWRQSATRISAVFGQGSGGLIYSAFGAPVLFLVDGITYVFSAVSELFVRIPSPAKPEQADDPKGAFRRVWEDAFEGLRYVWQRPGMRAFLLIEGVANFFLMPMLVLLPFYVEKNLQAGVGWYGWLLAGMSAGGVAGFALAGTIPLTGRRRAYGVLAACLAGELFFGLLTMIDRPLLALIDLFALGVVVGLFNVQAVTIFQTATSGAFRGRVMGLLGTISMGAAPIGMLLAGVVGDLTGRNVTLIYGACSVMAIVLTLIVGMRGAVLDFLSEGPQQANEAWEAAIATTTSAPIQKGLRGEL